MKEVKILRKPTFKLLFFNAESTKFNARKSVKTKKPIANKPKETKAKNGNASTNKVKAKGKK